MEVGSLLVRLNMDGADFHRNVGKARAGLNDLAAQAGKSTKQFNVFSTVATREVAGALGSLVPAAAGAEHVIGSLLQRMVSGGPAMAVFAKGAILVGAALAAFKAGEALGNWIFGPDSVKQMQEEAQAFEKWQVTASGIRRREARKRLEEEAKEWAERRAARDKRDEEELDKIRTQREQEAAVRAGIMGGAASAGAGIGLSSSIFSGFEEVAALRGDADKFSQAIDLMAKSGTRAKDLFPIIGQASDALSGKITELTQKYADQPLVLQQIEQQLSNLDQGGYQRALDSYVRMANGIEQGTAVLFQSADAFEDIQAVTGAVGPNLVAVTSEFDAMGRSAAAASLQVRQLAADLARFQLQQAAASGTP